MNSILYRLEKDADDTEIATLVLCGFGGERPDRAVNILRHNTAPIRQYSFVAHRDNKVVGSIRFTYVSLPKGRKVPLLGPLVVDKKVRSQGIGRKLIGMALPNICCTEAGVLVVGIEPYYTVYGFNTYCVQNLRLNGQIQPFSLMGLECEKNVFGGEKGYITPCR